jgi:hypothetical protein
MQIAKWQMNGEYVRVCNRLGIAGPLVFHLPFCIFHFAFCIYSSFTLPSFCKEDLNMAYDFSRLTDTDLAAIARSRPGTPDQLHLFVSAVLGLRLPRQPICTDLGHHAPFDYLRDAFFEEFTDAVVWANRGGGKTMLGAVVSLLDAIFKDGAAIRILGGSLEQSRKMYRYLTRLATGRHVADRLVDAAGSPRPGPGQRSGIGSRVIRFATGSEVEILAQSERSVRGNRVQKMRCDEIELFDSDVWTSCQLVTESREELGGRGDAGTGGRGEGGGGRGDAPAVAGGRRDDCEEASGARGTGFANAPSPFLAPLPKGEGEEGGRAESSNPKSEIRNPKLVRGSLEAFSTFHRVGGLMQQVIEAARRRGSPVYRWCVLDVLERCPAQRDCATCPLAPECRGRAKKADGFYRIDDAIAAKARVSPETWESEMLCLRPSRRGAVFPAFSRTKHVAPLRYQPAWPMYRAIDFGFVNPFVCLWMQVSPAGDVYVLKEYLRSRTTIAEHAFAIHELDKGPVAMSYCDPAGGQSDQITGTSARMELKAGQIRTRCRQSAITDGLEIIRRHLDGIGGSVGSPSIRIDPSCERLIEAMEAYRYPEASDRRGHGAQCETPLKDGVHDHPIDALRYFFVNHVTKAGAVLERGY